MKVHSKAMNCSYDIVLINMLRVTVHEQINLTYPCSTKYYLSSLGKVRNLIKVYLCSVFTRYHLGFPNTGSVFIRYDETTYQPKYERITPNTN